MKPYLIFINLVKCKNTYAYSFVYIKKSEQNKLILLHFLFVCYVNAIMFV